MKRDRVLAAIVAAVFAFAFSVSVYAFSWMSNLTDGLRDAKAKKKPVMADFYTDWCGWCKKLDKDTYSDPKVAALAEKFICVKVDGEKYPDLVSKYGISGYPTIVFLDMDGKEVGRIVGYTDANGLIAKMKQVLSRCGAQTDKAAETAGEKPASGWKAKLTQWWQGIKNAGAQKGDRAISGKESTSAGSAGDIVFCDLIILNNGTRIQGAIEKREGDTYTVRLPTGKVTINKSDIKEIKRLSVEEACMSIGDRFLASNNLGAAMEEYKKILKTNPNYKPAKDAINLVKKKKMGAIEQQKLEEELEREASEAKASEPVAVVNPSLPIKRIEFGFHIMNRESLKRSYDYKDFGFLVDDNIVVNGFYPKDPTACNKVFPAQEAGMRVGDKIISINGKDASGLTSAEAKKFIGTHRYSLFLVERQ